MKQPTTSFMALAIWVFVFLWSVSGLAGPVPDTGQTKCYDDVGNVIQCPQPGQPFYGQDANYTINPPSYTKLDASGNALPDSASSWVMVRDNLTGLIWEVKQNKDEDKNYSNPHDADNEYTWYDSNPATNGGDAGMPGDGTDTEDFIGALNTANFGGYSDWRLPSLKELQSLINYHGERPMIDKIYFPHTKDRLPEYYIHYRYWSSTTDSEIIDPYDVYSVSFDLGIVFADWKSLPYDRCAKAVRGEEERHCNLMSNGDGTVTDLTTGLMWQQGEAPNNFSWEDGYTWEEALIYCEELELAGYSDWRLPTIKELVTILKFSNDDPNTNDYFPGLSGDYDVYWSSTTENCSSTPENEYLWQARYALGAILTTRYSYTGKIKSPYKNERHFVRAVRGGQSGALGDLVIAQTPMSGPPGTTFTQWGTGFSPGSTATMRIRKPDGTEYTPQPVSIDEIGHFEIPYTAEPDKAPGNYTWWVVDGPTQQVSNQVTYEIEGIPGQLHHFIFAPIESTTVGTDFEISIEAVDYRGDRVSSFNGDITLTHNGPGTLSETGAKLENGYVSLWASLNQPNTSCIISCHYSGVTGQSNEFAVTGGSTATGRVYGLVKGAPGIANVILSRSPYGLPLFDTNTNSVGYYSFSEVPGGHYYVWAVDSAQNSSVSQAFAIESGQTGRVPDLIIHGSKRPVIFVPGIMGTTSKLSGEVIYPTLPKDFPADQGYLQIHNPGLLLVGWEQLKIFLDDHYEVYECPYDWRVSLKNRKDTYKKYLLPIIEKAKEKGWEKVDIVAHSMGGLLVRSYIQSLDYKHDIDKFAMVGTPNYGSLNVYPMWEGGDPILADNNVGDIFPSFFYSNVTNNLYRVFYGRDFLSYENFLLKMCISKEECRRFLHANCPSAWQLMPIYDKCLNPGEIKTWKNRWLIDLNNDTDISRIQYGGEVKTRIFNGNSETTQTSLDVKESTVGGLYEDGEQKGSPRKGDSGDGTVLASSAKLASVESIGGSGGHGTLVRSFAFDIAAFLNEGRTFAGSAREPLTVAQAEAAYTSFLGISVTGPPSVLMTASTGARCGIDQASGEVFEEPVGSKTLGQSGNAMVVISDPTNGIFTVKLSGSQRGTAQIKISYMTKTEAEEKRLDFYYPGTPVIFTLTLDASGSPKLKIGGIPPAPEGFSKKYNGNEAFVGLTWKPSADDTIVGYRIYVRDRYDADLTVLAEVAADQTFYDTTDAWNEPVRIYAVSALDNQGREGFLTNFIDNKIRLLADFETAIVDGGSPLVVQFTDSSTGTPTTWLWDFGDGETSIEQNPTHTYTEAGDYSVSLTVSDAQGLQDLIRKAVRVKAFIAGDVNGDFLLDLSDAIAVLQFVSSIESIPAQAIHPETDIDGDGAIGLAEAVYVLQRVAGVR